MSFLVVMEALDRIIISKDWITILLLGIVFLIILVHFFDSKRLQQLFLFSFNKSYRLNYSYHFGSIFTILLFVINTLIISLFVYVIISVFYPDKIDYDSVSFITILFSVLFYWVLSQGLIFTTSYFFDIKKYYYQSVFTKMGYLYSSTLYLLILLIFNFYLFDSNAVFVKITILSFGLLLIIRYIHFISTFKSQISSHIFYYILYLCALEIAPLLIAIKVGVN